MDTTKCLVALFDFDGVVVDTEQQYSQFWNRQGENYLPNLNEFGCLIKGQTLTQIFDGYFSGNLDLQNKITSELNEYEKNMNYDYIPGVIDFMKELRLNGIKIGIVTSSNNLKMSNVYKAHPELTSMVDCILTADMFTKSKPHPECFLLGAKTFDTVVENCIVFEDSYQGLEAARRAEMKIVALSTTNPHDDLVDKADIVIRNFVGFNIEQIKDLFK